MSEPKRYRTQPGQAGFAAFHLDIPFVDCKHSEGSAERTEWELGWTRAEAGWDDWMTPPASE